MQFEADAAEPPPPVEYLQHVAVDFTRNDPVLPSNELVVFFGPPFCGKTRYFDERFASTHTRVCARELFAANAKLSLHAVVKMVVQLLVEGQNVVLDDEHMKLETRASYLDAVRQRMPPLRVRAINFWPFGGHKQCLWAREFAVTELSQSSGFASIAEIGEWFSSLLKRVPKRHEGYSHILNVRSYLFCNAPKELSRPALFLDAAALVSFVPIPGSEMCEARRRFPECNAILSEWLHDHPDGVVVALAPEALLFPASVEMYADDPLSFLQLLEAYHQQMVSELTLCAPPDGALHVVGCGYTITDNWWLPPNPGMIAAAQRIHGIDLCAATFACEDNSPWHGLARELGLTTVRAERLFQSREQSGWATSVRLRKFSVRADATLSPVWGFTRSMSAGSPAESDDICKRQGDVAGCWWRSLAAEAVQLPRVQQSDKGKEEDDLFGDEDLWVHVTTRGTKRSAFEENEEKEEEEEQEEQGVAKRAAVEEFMT
jgi:hypothetical protein